MSIKAESVVPQQQCERTIKPPMAAAFRESHIADYMPQASRVLSKWTVGFQMRYHAYFRGV